jgi:hypothetical protein
MALYLSGDFRRLTDDRHRRGHRLNKPLRPGDSGVLRISCPGTVRCPGAYAIMSRTNGATWDP